MSKLATLWWFAEAEALPAGAHVLPVGTKGFKERFYAPARSKGYAPDERTLDMIREVQSEYAAGPTMVGPAEYGRADPHS